MALGMQSRDDLPILDLGYDLHDEPSFCSRRCRLARSPVTGKYVTAGVDRALVARSAPLVGGV